MGAYSEEQTKWFQGQYNENIMGDCLGAYSRKQFKVGQKSRKSPYFWILMSGFDFLGIVVTKWMKNIKICL